MYAGKLVNPPPIIFTLLLAIEELRFENVKDLVAIIESTYTEINLPDTWINLVYEGRNPNKTEVFPLLLPDMEFYRMLSKF